MLNQGELWALIQRFAAAQEAARAMRQAYNKGSGQLMHVTTAEEEAGLLRQAVQNALTTVYRVAHR